MRTNSSSSVELSLDQFRVQSPLHRNEWPSSVLVLISGEEKKKKTNLILPSSSSSRDRIALVGCVYLVAVSWLSSVPEKRGKHVVGNK